MQFLPTKFILKSEWVTVKQLVIWFQPYNILSPSFQECEHNLSKPEFNPLSIKFKIQLIALYVYTCWFSFSQINYTNLFKVDCETNWIQIRYRGLGAKLL